MPANLRARLAAFAAARGWSRLAAARELLRRALDAADARSAGGLAAAHNLTAAERHERAKKAAEARWGGTPTYDERRGEMRPCRCGMYFTHPERCEAMGECLGKQHPHARTASQLRRRP